MAVPRLTAAQSRRRVARLRRAGCRVETRTLPSGDRVVLKKCPELFDNPRLNRDEAIKYAKRIKNQAKRDYAFAWIEHAFRGAPEPPRPTNLSFMGAQAVRLEIGKPELLDNQVPAPNVLGYAVLAAFGAAVLYAIFRPRRAEAQPTEPAPPPACELNTGEDFARLENWALANDVGVVYLPATDVAPSPATSELAAGIARSAANLVVVTSDGNFWTYTTGEPVLSPALREQFCAFRSAPGAVGWIGTPTFYRIDQ